MMNKKAMMDDMFDFIFTVAAAVIILLFMTTGLSGGQKDQGSLEGIVMVYAENNLLAYLKSPISENENMADFIIRWYYDKDELTDKLESESTKILKRLPLTSIESDGWSVRIFSMPGDVEEIEINPYDYEDWTTSINLPLVEEDKYLKVDMIHLECESELCK